MLLAPGHISLRNLEALPRLRLPESRHAELVSASIVPPSSGLDGEMDAETSSA
jgi:hypothetical protein